MRLPAILFFVVLIAGCSAPTPEEEPTPPASTPTIGTTPGTAPGTTPTPTPRETPHGPPLPRWGVAISPASFDGPEFGEFFVQAKETGGLLLWGGSADVLADTLGAADVTAQLAKQHDLTYGAQVGFHKEDAPFDASRQRKALLDVVEFAQRTKPAFLVLGVEIDRIHDHDPAFVDAFAHWYDRAYEGVKNASPGTLVFPSFQYEHTRGLTGGLFGGPELGPQKWDLLAKFPKRDLTAFTTYPSLLYKSPAGIPDDYWDLAFEKAGGPVAFTEIGYHAGSPAEGWESSPEEQERFLERFLTDADRLQPRFAIWLHLHDQEQVEPSPFKTMGLADADGNKRPAYDRWWAVANGR